ncbi:Cellulose-binding domain protein [Neorhizobium galegae bv. officinalis bv. officinalis str. HAMBI 1141]|uniref:Cellulose-binding domain protein n=1 Tax=Neorhizobium galegae bv. officinalis bv. officinalis str. HAMBI 1141 TaxID=1028801 RepID=A0A068TC90_NEOGA|nr:hypothetical protein [Neorhizobium galegae]CDN55729.1 Cellulose-binding domain protein [Neorhizobium galegae bv. officinalis bv. officinalis str. HAMBI 1141]
MNRRMFLQMLSNVAIAPVLSGIPSGANAGDEIFPEQVGLNITGMSYWATEQAFSNLAYNASPWRVQVKDAPFTWDTPLPPMTKDGYPTRVPAGSFVESFLIFTAHRKNLPVQLSVHYDGKGKLGYIAGAELESRSPGRDDVRNLRKEAPFTSMVMETDPTDPIRNIRVYERGPIPKETFRAPFLDRLSGMSTLRFMDWMGTNNSRVQSWSDRPRPGQFGKSELGVPLEHMIELCNLVKSDPWFNMPHLADDDYVRHFAEQVRKDLDPDLKIHVEYSNEVWNTSFDQADHARSRGLALGFSTNDYEAQLRYYAQRTNEILAIWEDIFGAARQRIVGVYSAQSVNVWTSETILSWKGVKAHADVLAIAPYFGGGFGAPDRQEEVSRWSLNRLFSALENEVETDNKKTIQEQAAIAKQYGVKLYAYEGGQHLVGSSGAENNERLTNLFVAANRDRRMGELYLRHLRNWRMSGGDLYAVFSSMSEPNKWGSWGLLEEEGGSHPKWQAIQQVLKRKPAL